MWLIVTKSQGKKRRSLEKAIKLRVKIFESQNIMLTA